jgi:hypothetical protein
MGVTRDTFITPYPVFHSIKSSSGSVGHYLHVNLFLKGYLESTVGVLPS